MVLYYLIGLSPGPLSASERGSLQIPHLPKSERFAKYGPIQAPPFRFGEGAGGEACALFRQFFQFHPAPGFPRLDARFGELDALCALQKAVLPRGIQNNVFEEHFPLRFETVVKNLVGGNGHPVGLKINRAVQIGVPHRAGRRAVGLDDAVSQARYRRSFGAVHMNREQVVAAHAGCPRRVELRDNAFFQFKGGIRGIVGGAGIRLAGFVNALGNVGGSQARHGFDGREDIVQHVPPVAQHINDDAAAVFFAVVPRRPLGRNGIVTGENPVAELAAHG